MGSVSKRAEDYTTLNDAEHVLRRIPMYAGSPSPVEYLDRWIYNYAENKMMKSTFKFIPAVERVFLEILSNASDTIGDCHIAGIKPGPISVQMNETYISITNVGVCVPVERSVIKNKTGAVIGTQDMYVPQQAFGTFKTGSNFVGEDVGNEANRILKKKKNQNAAGQNGIGSKLCNALSKQFIITICDATNKKKYTQIWENNMEICHPPSIEDYNLKVTSVNVTYLLDFARFNIEKYDAFAQCLFTRHAADVAFNTRNEVIFNGISFKIFDIKTYAELYFQDIQNPIIYSQWSEDVEMKTPTKPVDSNIFPEIELLVMDTPDMGESVSFVNCLMTPGGGKHVDDAISSVSDGIVSKLNEDMLKKVEKISKTPLTQVMKNKLKINKKDVMNHITVFISVRIENPDLDSQTKDKLNTFPLKMNIPSNLLDKVSKWRLQHRLKDAIDSKKLAIMESSKKKKGSGNTEDANFAAEKGKKQDTILYITEGDSAAGYVRNMRKSVYDGCDFIGILPIRGKCLNVTNADILQIDANEEYQELKKALGLEEFVDYSIDENFAKLRYGNVMLLTDADVDGKHIVALLLNYFHSRFRALLKRKYIMYYRTPILRVWKNLPSLDKDDKGDEVYKFYTKGEFFRWAKDNSDKIGNKKWSIKYYKGLGTSDDWDVLDDLSSPRKVYCIYDDKAHPTLELAFNKKYANNRKEWISSYEEMLTIEQINSLPIDSFFDNKLWSECVTSNNFDAIRYTEALSQLNISWFLDKELLTHSVANNLRTIPLSEDGLKESTRKLIHTAHQHWNITKKGKMADLKVEQFGGHAANITEYEYGENNLKGVIVNLAQNNFVGSNIVNLFEPSGNYGTSWKGGNDSAAFRYLYTSPSKYMAYIFRKEDLPILEYRESEGKKIEPVKYYPIVPIHIINGVKGIGTGWSTYIPSHNPIDIVSWLRNRIRNNQLPNILPYFNHYRGDMSIVTKQVENEVDSEIETITDNDTDIDNEEDVQEEIKYTTDDKKWKIGTKGIICSGKYHMNGNEIVVTALPVGLYPYMYEDFLKKLVTEKKITKFSKSENNGESFTIKGWKESINEKSLRLIKNYGLGNMVLLDQNQNPKHYESIDQIMEEFYQSRIIGYEKRKVKELETIDDEIKLLNQKKSFLEMVHSDQIVLKGRKKEDILKDMDKYDFKHSFYTHSTLDYLSNDKIPEIVEDIQKLINKHQIVMSREILVEYETELLEFLDMYNNLLKTKSKNMVKLSKKYTKV